ncbi:hypothetical protein KC19_VG321300 [Ceratodon purpureus]|uniref:Uncharacterized protein n=1 Tax=Ceratodon purpureus TaxID=3225 RepID=A0A8T0HVL5_CERPU|nr:hypothetical protein KC19_VG321300 [Ceratodon purpureus]
MVNPLIQIPPLAVVSWSSHSTRVDRTESGLYVCHSSRRCNSGRMRCWVACAPALPAVSGGYSRRLSDPVFSDTSPSSLLWARGRAPRVEPPSLPPHPSARNDGRPRVGKFCAGTDLQHQRAENVVTLHVSPRTVRACESPTCGTHNTNVCVFGRMISVPHPQEARRKYPGKLSHDPTHPRHS